MATFSGDANVGGALDVTGNLTYTAGTGTFDQSASSGTFDTGTGAVRLNGDVTIASGKSFTVLGTGTVSLGGSLTVTGTLTTTGNIVNNGAYQQNGSGTFSTGTGVVTLNGDTTIASGKTFTVAGTGLSTFGGGVNVTGATTLSGGLTIAAGTTLNNAGSTLYTSMAIPDTATNTTFGNGMTAAATVNGHTSFDVTQTTAGRTLTLPTPSPTTSSRVVYINSLTGNVPFTMYGVNITAGNTAVFVWNGSSNWVPASTGGNGVNTIGALNGGVANATGATILALPCTYNLHLIPMLASSIPRLRPLLALRPLTPLLRAVLGSPYLVVT